ncbi:hypothetical protein [Calidithermus chliarophilus]|uniref:hypothetical protein n=1 Tax=Calidithermus chliarophilus TaxID=52023 RepID=UPI0004083DF1|nr:hypothetical protein [Calidithermus chliarophilus]
MADHLVITAYIPAASPLDGGGGAGSEAFKLPGWFARDGANAPLLQTLWAALQNTRPEHALAMTYLSRATGQWLDLHASLYGLHREFGEGDAALRSRILAEVQNPRSTPQALENALLQGYGLEANVWDLSAPAPYEESIRYYDGSLLYDGSETYGSGTVFGPFPNPFGVFVVDVTGDAADAQRAREVVLRLRAAGMVPVVRYSPTGAPPYTQLP